MRNNEVLFLPLEFHKNGSLKASNHGNGYEKELGKGINVLPLCQIKYNILNKFWL